MALNGKAKHYHTALESTALICAALLHGTPLDNMALDWHTMALNSMARDGIALHCHRALDDIALNNMALD